MDDSLSQLYAYLRDIWRFRWKALLLAWILALAGWAAVYNMPDKYEARARVYIDTESILRPLLQGLAVQPDVSERVKLITQALLSRPNLERIAKNSDLALSANGPLEMERLLTGLADSIVLENSKKQGNLYGISYQHRDPVIAKQVVQAVLDVFVESALGDSRQDSTTAQRFLERQLKEYKARLTDSENRLTEYKRQNIGLLPEQGQSFFTRLQNARDKLREIDLELKEAEFGRQELQKRMVAELEKYSSVQMSPEYIELSGKIATTQNRLDDALLRFTENHPEVQRQREMLASLKAQRDELEKQYVNAMAGRNNEEENDLIQNLKLSISEADAHIAAVKVRRQEYLQRIQQLEKSADTLPEIEAEMSRLERDYQNNKKNYEDLLVRLESAKLSEDAEKTGDNLKFRVVDPPWVPMMATHPNRLLFNTGVFGGALAVAIVLVLMLAQMRAVFYDTRDLQDVTGLPVFGVVSKVEMAGSWARKMREGALLGLGIGGLCMVYLVVLYEFSPELKQILS